MSELLLANRALSAPSAHAVLIAGRACHDARLSTTTEHPVTGGAKTIVGPIHTTTRGIGTRAHQTVLVRRGGRSTSRATVSAHKTQILKPVAQDAPNLHKVCQP